MLNYVSNLYNRFKGSETGTKRRIIEGEYYSDYDTIFRGRKLTATMIEEILTQADSGYSEEQSALFNLILDKEPIINAHLQTRMLAVSGCKWQITNKDNKQDQEVEREVRDFGIDDANTYLLNAIGHGYAGVITLWDEGGKAVKKFEEIYQGNIIFDLAGNPALRTNDGKEVPFADYIEGQFILHKHRIKTGLPSQQGLLRCLVWLYLYKYYGLQHNARFLEKFGSPFLTAKLSKADFNDPEIYNKTKTALKNAGFAGNAIMPEGSELAAVSVNAQSGGQAHLDWFNYIDDIFAIVILGQVATKGESTGMSNGNAQENVRLDLLDADCKGLSATINKQFMIPWQIFKFGKDTGLRYKIAYEEPDDLKSIADTVLTLSNAGFKAQKEWVEERFNIPIDKTEPQPQQPGNPQQMQAFSERTPDKFLAREEYITKLTENTLDGLFKNKEVIARMYKPLTEAIRDVFSGVNPENENILQVFSDKVDGLFKKFPALYDDIDTSDMQKAIQSACLASMVKGYASKPL